MSEFAMQLAEFLYGQSDSVLLLDGEVPTIADTVTYCMEHHQINCKETHESV